MTPSGRRKVLILGSGPNRIGQGIEFDYCCVHASFALGDAGFETVMLNCNPETVSTDYDTSDRLYFEPLTLEDALNVIEAEQAAGELVGVVVALGGQTPLKLAASLPEGLVLGTSPASIDAAEDRELWNALCARLEIPQPAGGTATTVDDALAIIGRIGYPALLRPSYVLGGRAMEIVYDEDGPASGDGRAGQLRQPRHRGRPVGVAARADRPVPRGRHRGRRRRHPRPHRRGGDRRRDGTRRGGRGPLGRLGLLDPAALAGRRHRGRDRGLHPAPGRRPRRPRADQRAVRGQAGPGLRHRGQPPGQPHRPVRGQGDRRPAGEGGRPGHGRGRRSPSCGPRACCARRWTAGTSR